MGENTFRESFKEVEMASDHNFKLATGFTNNSLILAFGIGIIELFARFKEENSKYLKILNFKLTETAQKAKETFPEQANNIEFYLSFINQIKQYNESDAFNYIYYFTIQQPENYINIIETGFRMIIAQLFENKRSYMSMIFENIGLDKIKFLIFYRICNDFGIHIEFYGIDNRETIKNENLGDFPILNVLGFNNQYYLLYNNDSLNEFKSQPLPDQIKLKPPFMISTRNTHVPVGRPTGLQSPAVSIPTPRINYNDTVGLTKMIIEKLTNELTKFEFSKDVSEFITECLKQNTEIAAIPCLQKFVSPVKSLRAMPSNEVSSDILCETTSLSMRRNANNANIVCGSCKISRPHNHFSSSIHNACKICLVCASQSEYCLTCRYPYTNEEKALLRNINR